MFFSVLLMNNNNNNNNKSWIIMHVVWSLTFSFSCSLLISASPSLSCC